MDRAWHYLQGLCRHQHRGSATPQEAAAATEISQWLHAMGYQVETERFRAPRDTLYLGPALVAGAFVVAAVIGVAYPWAGLLLCTLFLIPLLGEMLGSTRIDFDLILPRYPSQNLVIRRAAQGARARTLVISAHYDTQRASYLFHPAFSRWLQPFFYLVYAGLILVPVGIGLNWFASGPAGSILLRVLIWVVGGCALFLLLCKLTGRHINGANDNGTGAGLLLALAERYVQSPMPDTDLVFLLTGSEEVGTRGMKHFVQTTALDRATTRFINLDNLGGGQLHYLTGEGMLRYSAYGADLLREVEHLAVDYAGRVSPRRNLLLPTDGLIPTLAGYQTITFLAFRGDGSLPDYHWYTDRPERIDRELLAFAEEFLVAYLERLARRPATGEGQELTPSDRYRTIKE